MIVKYVRCSLSDDFHQEFRFSSEVFLFSRNAIQTESCVFFFVAQTNICRTSAGKMHFHNDKPQAQAHDFQLLEWSEKKNEATLE